MLVHENGLYSTDLILIVSSSSICLAGASITVTAAYQTGDWHSLPYALMMAFIFIVTPFKAQSFGWLFLDLLSPTRLLLRAIWIVRKWRGDLRTLPDHHPATKA